MSEARSHPDIPEQSWTNPFPDGHPMHDLYGNRVRNHQDLVIIIDDYHARRGTGKTVASLQMAEGMDQNGGLTFDNVSLQAENIHAAYSELPERSAIVLDEGEVGASKYDAMAKTNKALREVMSMGRVEEKYVIINTPSFGFLDKEIRLLADVWMTMLRKGLALVHFLKRQPYSHGGGGSLLTEKNGLIEFKDIEKGTELRKVYNKLTREKRKRIKGEEGESFIPQSEHNEKVAKAVKEAKKEKRDELVDAFYNHPEVQAPQRVVADCAGVAQKTVSNIVR